MRLHPSFAVLGLLACVTACSVNVPQPEIQPAIIGELKDRDLLSKLCGRPLAEIEANSSGFSFTITELSATRSFFGKEGKGTAKVSYASTSGPPCVGRLAFDFRDVGTMRRQGRRAVSYTSKFELTNFVATPAR
ncbi:MAG TPA: hypothetical protein VLT33_02085 [Labilithrix sp.]|nr:hypothetical protein [Labilithrix sp.]